MTASPFHAGERAVQERVGVHEQMEVRARVSIRDHMPDQHRAFFRQLPYLLVGALDQRGRPWASMLFGLPGFIASPDANVLQISTQIAAEDPLASAIDVGAALGLLGIELSTRRRNRAAGVVETVDGPGRFTIRVRQSFGNCPQYIQARKPLQPTGWRVPGVAQRSTSFAGWRALLQGADTLFIATRSALLDGPPAHGVDVSYRGGLPGFIEILDDRHFLFPDYRGNFFFNTFGNLLLDRRAGLLFPDFDGHGLLHMTGNVEVVWAQPDQQRFPGALRLVSVEVDEVLWRPHALPLDFEFAGYSPHLARLQAMPLSRPARAWTGGSGQRGDCRRR